MANKSTAHLHITTLNSKTYYTYRFAILIAACLLLFFAELSGGSSWYTPTQIIDALRADSNSMEAVILWKLRLPRILTAMLAGSALAVSGLLMQSIFRNPLAGPYVLGISSGASLGVALLTMGVASISSLGLSVNNPWLLITGAWIGAAGVLFLVLLASVRLRDVLTILILGILFGAATSSVVTILQYFSTETALKSYVIWTMGSFSDVSYSQLSILFPAILAGLILAFFYTKSLNALLFGEDYARTAGVPLKRTRTGVFIATTLLAGSVTAFCGPVGFIGIAVPHITRFIFRTNNHRILIPATILTGSALGLLSDFIAQLPGYAIVLPLNSVTALIGIPVIVWIVLANRIN